MLRTVLALPIHIPNVCRLRTVQSTGSSNEYHVHITIVGWLRAGHSVAKIHSLL